MSNCTTRPAAGQPELPEAVRRNPQAAIDALLTSGRQPPEWTDGERFLIRLRFAAGRPLTPADLDNRALVATTTPAPCRSRPANLSPFAPAAGRGRRQRECLTPEAVCRIARRIVRAEGAAIRTEFADAIRAVTRRGGR